MGCYYIASNWNIQQKKSGYQSEITAAEQGYRQKEHFFKREYKKEISSILTLSPKNPVASD